MEPVRVSTESGKAPKTYGEKRRCSECGCFLNRYNSDATCSACTPPDRRMMRMTGRRSSRQDLEATG